MADAPTPAPSPIPPSWLPVPGAAAPAQGMTLMEIVQNALLGASGRQGATSQPLVGPMPAWVANDPNARAFVQQGKLDPYLPGSSPDTWQVFIAAGAPSPTTKPGRTGWVPPPDGDTTRTAGSVKNDPYLWDADKVNEAIAKFRAAGFTSVQDFDSMRAAWGSLVDRAAATYSLSSGQMKVGPWDVLELYKDEAKAQGYSPDGSRTTHSVQRTVSEISQGDAWAALRSTVSSMLGRDPDDQEVRDFAYRMNNLAAKSPSISRSTQTVDAAGNSTVSTRTKPGFNSSDVARGAYDEAQDDEDYAEYQSATTYFNAAMSAMGAIGGN